MLTLVSVALMEVLYSRFLCLKMRRKEPCIYFDIQLRVFEVNVCFLSPRLVVRRQEWSVFLEKQILLKGNGVVWSWMSP